jgi:hypothetical protein
MNKRIEQSILLAIALVSGATAFGLNPTSAALMLAALNLALALCVNY